MLMGWYSEGWAMFMNIVLTMFITQGTGLAFIVMADVFTKVGNHFLGKYNKTLPKAQRTRGLSSTYQSNFFGSYHKFKHKS